MNGDNFALIDDCKNDFNKIEEFIKLASEALKSNSLFEIGDHDSKFFNIKSCMERYGFKQVMKNVYKKV